MASYQMVGFEVRQGGFDLRANYLKEMGHRVKTCIPAGCRVAMVEPRVAGRNRLPMSSWEIPGSRDYVRTASTAARIRAASGM